MLRSRRLFGLLSAITLTVLAQSPAHAGVEQLWEYTVSGISTQTFKTLGEAEAAMRGLPDKPITYSSGITIQEMHGALQPVYMSSASATSYGLEYRVPPVPAVISEWSYYAPYTPGGPESAEGGAVKIIIDYYTTPNCTATASPNGGWYTKSSISPDYVMFWLAQVQFNRDYIVQQSCNGNPPSEIKTGIYRRASASCSGNYVLTNSTSNSNLQDPPGSQYVLLSKGCQNPTTGKITAKLVPAPCNGKSNPGVGNPCSPATGAKYETETDIPDGGTGIGFRRSYNSRQDAAFVNALGAGWSHSFATKLITVPGGSPYATIRADGAWETWRYVATNTYVSAQWTGRQLRLVGSEWRLTDINGDREIYDTFGKLVRTESAAGRIITLTYDDQRRVHVVTGPYGHTLTFGYDPASGRLASVTDSAGHTVSYEYDGDNLARVNYPDGTVRSYHYEDPRLPHHLTGISVNGVRFSSFAYDDRGRAVLTEHAGGAERNTLAYNADGTTTVTDASGQATVYSFSSPTAVPRLVSKVADSVGSDARTYDNYQRVTAYTNERGVKTTYVYDNYHRTSQTEAAGTPEARTTTYQYLANDSDLPTLIESPSVGGGSLTKRTAIAYDPTLRVPRTLTQTGYTPSGTAVSRTITLDYNSYGQVTAVDGPRADVSDVTTLTYYECTTGGACGQLKRVTNALGQITTYDVYDAAGRLIEQTDPNGLKTFYGYDLRGRVLSVTLKAPDGSTRLTAYTYDPAGNITEVKTPDGRALTYTYDAAQYLRTVTDNFGNKVEYGYDLKGNRTATKTFDPQGTLVRSIELAFDARNRVKEINDGGSITQQVWDAIGNLTKVTDPNTVAVSGTTATVNEYDALNRLFKTTDRLSGLTQYGYDSGDRVKQVTTPNTATTGYEVDDLGNVLKETSPDRGVLTYGYDQAGNVTSLLDARGITATYRYDALNRPTNTDFPGTEEDVAYTYDTVPGCTHGIGRLCTVSDAAGANTYAYDAFGNVTEATRTGLGVSAITRYGYDAMNRVSAITYPDGRKVDYTRNTLGQVTGVTLTQGGATQSLASQLTYRADGLLTGLTTGNGVAESRLYSLAGRLESWTVGSETRGFIYDANGNLKDKTGAAVANFSYDALDRLKDESLSGFAQSFTYDPNGNRKSDGLGSYDYLAQSNRLSTAPGGSITLDPAGNLMTQGARSFGYYSSGQLRDITEAGTPLAAYAYNSERLRTRKTIGTDTTVYHYDLAGNLLMETDAAGTPKRAYVWLNGRPLAQLDPSGIVYLHTDHLDTPRLATNAQGTIVWRWEGEAFGDTAASEDPDGDGTLTTVSLRFPGQYYDQETGLHYNWNRYYDPKIGRYITSDPIGIEGGLNTYSYVGNNPLGWIDPLGLEMECPPGMKCYPTEMPPTDRIPPKEPKWPGNNRPRSRDLCSQIEPTYATCVACCVRNSPQTSNACREQCSHRDPPYPDAPFQTSIPSPIACSQ